jgi:spore coat polysaccharide biosynthesis predicted glycosyltransferase SpsG
VADDDAARHADALATLEAGRACGFKFDLVVVDHYGLGPTWERTVRATGANVVALDDFPGRPHAANQVVELLPCASATPGRLAGLEYLPMDRAYDLPPVSVPTNGVRVVVTFGASDPTGHTLVALDALDRLDALVPGLLAHADIVIGAAHPAPDAVAAGVFGVPRRSLHRQEPSLVLLMRDAHVVLTAAGNAMSEAVAAGRRTIAVVTADNQATLADTFAATGVVHRIPSAGAATAAALAQALQYVVGPGGRAIDVALARRPVDTFGADRLVAALVPYARREAP